MKRNPILVPAPAILAVAALVLSCTNNHKLP